MRDGTSVVRVQAGGPPQAVTAPTLPGLGLTEVLRLSPDGVRAALVVDGPGGRALYVGTVVRAEDGSVALRDFRAIAPELSQVVDVAWRDSGTLLVLAGDAGEDRIVPYSVGVDGWGLTRDPDGGAAQPAALDRRGADPAAAGQRRRHDLAARRRHLGHAGARPGAAAGHGALLPALRPARSPSTDRRRDRPPGGPAGQAGTVGRRRDRRAGRPGAAAHLRRLRRPGGGRSARAARRCSPCRGLAVAAARSRGASRRPSPPAPTPVRCGRR